MNLKAVIAALEVSGFTRYAISMETGIPQSTLSRIMSGPDSRRAQSWTVEALLEFAALHKIGPNGEKIKRKRKAA